jgi:RimJ/RimL family protein N-acetyltransferase
VKPPEALADEGVALRPLREDDVPAYAAAFRDDTELGRLIGVERDPDEAAVRERIAEQHTRPGFELAITADGSDAFRGLVAVHSIEPDHGRAVDIVWLGLLRDEWPARRSA